ncbi:GMC family oxidoreductase [Falsirhodobacter algicola]|uniref:GMC family oxidoreductase n=1 Tax=Falsirhodobacter algicola TaxID=2692330 RepID=A0A8J8SM39_9RHOB|nr:GMC family oxidoreductase [Falsirhodobacter algicola]QUS37016.1 GMC family oxidoreductase [Falsirhodobacter algicola]
MAVKPQTDAVIIGMGWTGSILAKQLTDAGLNVVALERGPDRHTQPDFAYPRVVDAVEGSIHRKFLQPLNNETVTVRHNRSQAAVPMRRIGSFKPGTGVGGAGTHWSGCHFRAMPDDLRLRSHIEERFGLDLIPDDMLVQDYPFSWEEMEPHFDMFEKVCGTSGRAGVLNGQRREGGNPFEGSRSAEYPLGPNPDYLGSEMFTWAAREAGYNPYPIPASNASASYVNPYGCQMGPCNACGFCSDYGCLNYSKASPNVNILPVLRRRQGFELRANAQVLRINLSEDRSRATGVTYVDLETGEEHEQPAGLVLLCAYQLYNVHLMLLSGIGQPYDPVTGTGTVGRNYAYQNLNALKLHFDENTHHNTFIGIGGAGATIDDLNVGQLDMRDAGFIGGGILWARQPGSGPVRGIDPPPGAPSWGRGWKQGVRQGLLHSCEFEAQTGVMSYRDNYLSLDPTYRDAWGRPMLRMTFNWKPNEAAAGQWYVDKLRALIAPLNPLAVDGEAKAMDESWNTTSYQSTHNTGGAVMAATPEGGALNRYCQSWDVPNVFAPGANAFPQNHGYNPTGLVGALAYWTAEAITGQYLNDPGALVR